MHYKTEAPGLLDICLAEVRGRLPAVDALLARNGDSSLRDYVQRICRVGARGYQDNGDFIEVFAESTAETLGGAVADKVAAELRELPQVLTVNHHGIDSFAQSTQSNLLFSMRKKACGAAVETIPVLACGSVPLNNLTFPRGLLVYGGDGGGIRRLPLFPDSHKKKLVSAAGAFTAEMTVRCRSRAMRMVEDGKLPRALQPALESLLDDFAEIDGRFPDYSRQATVLNNRIWQRLLRGREHRSELVYIDLESIASRLLAADLRDASTIACQLLFDPALRRELIERLDGHRGCWNAESLLRRCAGPGGGAAPPAPGFSAGTMLFWGVDDRSRQLPLALAGESDGAAPVLRGVDSGGQVLEIPFSAEAIERGLRERRLLPSIFTSYLLVDIARGVQCVGGYYQADYLPVMREAVNGLLGAGPAPGTTPAVRPCGGGTAPDAYLSGMQAIALESGRRLLPAGPVEIIAAGGLDAAQYERIGGVTVLAAHIASLHDTLLDIASDGDEFGWTEDEISRLVHDEVAGEIVMIST